MKKLVCLDSAAVHVFVVFIKLSDQESHIVILDRRQMVDSFFWSCFLFSDFNMRPLILLLLLIYSDLQRCLEQRYINCHRSHLKLVLVNKLFRRRWSLYGHLVSLVKLSNARTILY